MHWNNVSGSSSLLFQACFLKPVLLILFAKSFSMPVQAQASTDPEGMANPAQVTFSHAVEAIPDMFEPPAHQIAPLQNNLNFSTSKENLMPCLRLSMAVLEEEKEGYSWEVLAQGEMATSASGQKGLAISFGLQETYDIKGSPFMAQTSFAGLGFSPYESARFNRQAQNLTNTEVEDQSSDLELDRFYFGSGIRLSNGLEGLVKITFQRAQYNKMETLAEGLVGIPMLFKSLKFMIQPRLSLNTQVLEHRSFVQFTPLPCLSVQYLVHASKAMEFAQGGRLRIKLQLSLTEPLEEQLGWVKKSKPLASHWLQTLESIA